MSDLSKDEVGFAWRVVKISFVFTIVALAAAALHFLIVALVQRGLPRAIAGALTFVEYLMLTADLLWFLRFIMMECATHLKAIWESGVGFRTVLITLLLFLFLSIAIPSVAAFPYVEKWWASLTSYQARNLGH